MIEQDGVVVLPQPAQPSDQDALAAIYALFVQNTRWPTFDELDIYQDRRGRADTELVLAAMPPGLVFGVNAASLPIRPEQPIGLTVAGLAACGAEDVGIFLTLLQLATELESERSVDHRATLRRSDALARPGLPAAGRDELLTRAAWVLWVEPWGWTTFNQPSESGDWSFTLDRRVRIFRAVSDINEYWRRAHPAPVAPPLAVVVDDQPPPTVAAPRAETGWSSLLHPDIARLAHPRLDVGHDDNAVEEAWKVVAQKLRDLTGSTLDGTQLVNSVLGSNGALRFGDETEQGRSVHEGMANLARGLAQFGRNVRAHRPSVTEPSETETAALLLLASVFMQHLERVATSDSDSGQDSAASS